MFIIIGTTAQYLGESSASILLATGQGREATAQEAAECINRLIINGDARMSEANDAFERIYGNPFRKPGQSHAEVCEAIKLHREARSVEARLREANMAAANELGLFKSNDGEINAVNRVLHERNVGGAI